MSDKKQHREARLAAALRENLKRRKVQARQLAEQPDGNGDADRNSDEHS